MSDQDKLDLQKFWQAQEAAVYASITREICRGERTRDWVPYIFPYPAGVSFGGEEIVDTGFGLRSTEDAIEYLVHKKLGYRLIRCASVLMNHKIKEIVQIVGHPEDLQVRASMTLFASLHGAPKEFERVLDRFFGGRRCRATLEFMKKL